MNTDCYHEHYSRIPFALINVTMLVVMTCKIRFMDNLLRPHRHVSDVRELYEVEVCNVVECSGCSCFTRVQ